MRPPPHTTLPSFPDTEEIAKAFFEEAIRHLEDALILHRKQRHPASITSSMKAAELGLKALFILDGAMGWWPKAQDTHTPWNDASKVAILKRHQDILKAQLPTLEADITALEKLSPGKPNLNADGPDEQANTEYPFPSFDKDRSTGLYMASMHRPDLFFDRATSEVHYTTAHKLLVTLRIHYPTIASWRISRPRITLPTL
jgi:hypothetical protein